MTYKNRPYGSARIKNFLPSVPSLRYLNCCTMAGWHQCNELYSRKYDKGIKALFLIHTVDGGGKLEMSGRTYSLCADSIILVPPHTPVRYYTDTQVGAWQFYWLDLVGERALSTAEKLCEDGHCFLNGFTPLGEVYNDLLQKTLSETERSALIERIFEKIVSKAVFDEGKENALVEQILQYIDEHYKESLTLERLSQQFYFSQNQIIRTVRAKTGYTPHEYLTRIRLAKACELLQFTDTPIMEVGKTVGYENNSHFSAAFRRLYGLSPAKYRSHFAST